jgi:DNA-binding NarL/FixJ family response regulator
MIRLLIADDHAIVRSGLKQLFALSPDVMVTAEAANGAQVLAALRDNACDVLLLDVSMPGISGADLISRIRVHHPDLPVLILSMHNESQIARRNLKAGASGYVTKDSDPDMLLEAIRKVAAGGRFITPELAEKMAFDVGNPHAVPHERLTSRELHILQLLAKGRSLNDIAQELSISNKTVSTHKARLMQKMRIDSNAKLIRYTVMHGLAE